MFLYVVAVTFLSLAHAYLIKNDCAHLDGRNYRGDVSTTFGGLQCQRWDQQSPHKHDRTPEKYPYSSLESNYCRNPDGEPYPWCYTTSSKRWDFCNVPSCIGYFETCYSGNGESYRGEASRTESGKLCQRWDSQSPHEHTRTKKNYLGHGLDSNYCRNPDGEPRPWCYTVDPSPRWEFCYLEKCPINKFG